MRLFCAEVLDYFDKQVKNMQAGRERVVRQVARRGLTLAAVAAVCVGMAGCGSLSDVKRDGTSDEPVFPELDRSWFSHDDGTMAQVENLRLMQSGVSRDQVYQLLGRPQFSEGFRVREWDYLFHFQTANGLKPCQYKVLFDEDYRARSFHWKPAGCADLLKVKEPEPRVVEKVVRVTQPAPAVPAPQRFTLAGDGLFAFARSDIGSLSAAGRSRLDDIARQLQQSGAVDDILVTAHTDRIGSAESNMRLSSARAASVKQYLVQRGLPAVKIRARGMGESQPVTSCSGNQPRAALISCLAPDRRVEVEAFGVR